MRPERVAVAALAVVALAATAARAEPVRVAVYAPWAGPATADQRHDLAVRIEEAIAASGSGPAEVSSFAMLGDFRRAIAGGRVDLAVVDGGAVAALGKRMRVVASWSNGPWVLAARGATHGRRLALQAPDDPASMSTVNRLLRGQVPPGYFTAVVGAPVTADARELVVRDKADLVLLPRRLAAGMTELADLGSFGELGLAVSGSSPALEPVAQAVQSAVRAQLGGDWKPGAPGFPPPVGVTAPAIAAPTPPPGTVLDLLAPVAAPAPTLLLDQLWIGDDAR